MNEKLKPCPCCGNNSVRIRVYPPQENAVYTYFSNRYAVLCDYGDDGCGLESGHYKTMEEVINSWNQRTEKEEWVSVEDILPESGKRVFVYAPQLDQAEIRIGFYSVNGFYDAFECGCGIKLDSATHWKPLPAPPAKEKE